MLIQTLTVAAVAGAAFALCAAPQARGDEGTPGEAKGKPQSVYDFTVKDISGEDVDLGRYRGYVSVVVNVASK